VIMSVWCMAYRTELCTHFTVWWYVWPWIIYAKLLQTENYCVNLERGINFLIILMWKCTKWHYNWGQQWLVVWRPTVLLIWRLLERQNIVMRLRRPYKDWLERWQTFKIDNKTANKASGQQESWVSQSVMSQQVSLVQTATVLFMPFSFMPTFSGTQLRHKIRASVFNMDHVDWTMQFCYKYQ
jgi:hypothetical protein